MVDKVEGIHRGEHLVSEAPGSLSREVKDVAMGQDLVAGTILMLSTGKLVAHDGLIDTAGDIITEVEGVLWDNVDASSTGTNADTEAVYHDRLAEFTDADLTFPTESTAGGEKAAILAGLLLRNIKTR